MSVVDEVKARLDLVDYISESVPLKKAGRTFKARCPFHQERTPSFTVFPETQTWRCFGACAEGGDIFSFAMKQNGWDFKEALRHLAERAGVELEERTPQQAQQDARFERLLGVLSETASFFNKLLNEAQGAEIARQYVAKRSLNAETVANFQLGYAPDGWQTTLRHLQELGYSEDDAVDAGVVIRKEETGRVYDRFRHRLVIPIRDGRGRVIGFGARALRDEDNPKYLNSPQSDLFDKSTVLFGLDMARRAIRETETAVIVEGYMDVMQAQQAGFGNIVAQMGTALTEPQLTTLRKYADKLILALDPDTAGIQATQRGLEVVRQKITKPMRLFIGRDRRRMYDSSRMDFDVRILSLPPGQDPDDLIRERPDEWRRLIDAAEPVADYVIRVGTAQLDARASIFEKEKVARDLLPLLTATESKLQEEVNVQRLALALRLPEKRLMEIAREVRLIDAQERPTSPKLRQSRRTSAMDRATLQQDRARQSDRPRAAAPRRAPDQDAPPPEASSDAGPPPEVLAEQAQVADEWIEGPRPDWDETAMPPLDDEAGLPPEAMRDDAAPDRAGNGAPVAPQARRTQAQAGYCLGILLNRPELLFQADRVLREAQLAAQETFTDEARRKALQRALAPLSVEDFDAPVYRMIFAAVQAALWQDDLEPQAYIMQAVGATFGPQIEALREQERDPLEQLTLPGPLQQEVASIRKQQRKEGRILAATESELITAALNLRRERLRRDREELRFLHADSTGPDTNDEGRDTYLDSLEAVNRAITMLDREIQTREQVLYDR